MDTIQKSIVYAVNSDLDDGILYAEFETRDSAIEYAKRNLDKLPFVDELQVSRDANGEIDEVFEYKTIWDHTMADDTAEEAEDAYWDDLATMYDDSEKHTIGDTTWFESVDTDELVETLEENEDTVECKECFELFPKVDCIKVDLGYICPTCAECGTVSEDDTFKIDFPEYEKFSDGNDLFSDEPVPVEEIENNPISTPEEAIPFLVKDEEEAIVGYEQAAEVVAESDLENKEEILDTIDHIKGEEEEHIEELTDLVEPAEEPVDENDPVSEDEIEEIEDPEEELIKEDYVSTAYDTGRLTKEELYDHLVNKGDIVDIEAGHQGYGFEDTGAFSDGGYYSNSVVSVEYDNGIFKASETYMSESGADKAGDWDFETESFDELWNEIMNTFKPEDLVEHVNEEHPAVESDQELEGTDNAVVDCKIADVVAHSEDEKPLHEEFDRVRAAAQCSRKCYDFYNAVATNAPEKELKKHGKVAYKFVKDQFGLTGKKAEDLLISGYAVWKLLNGKSKYESLNEATSAEFDEILKLCKEIGIETAADLDRFVKDELEGNENLLDRLRAYRIGLDVDFEVKENLTEAKHDPFHEAIFEAIDYLTEFSDIFPVPGNIGANNWEELKDDINYGLSSDFEIAEIIMEYFQKDLAISEKHPEIFEDDPQSQLTLETYNRLKRAYDKAVADYEAKYPEDFEEQLDLTHGYDHIKSVTSLVHKAVENLTKDNRVGTRPDGMSFYVLSDKRSADPEKMKKVILDALAAEGYEPDEVQFVDKGQVYGYVVGKIKMMARATMSYQKKESLTEDADDAEFNPTSEDPAEKPSKSVKQANTEGTAGMDFEAACQKFGVELDN